MASWGATPQPVGKSRWRFAPHSRWPEGDLVELEADLEPSTVIDAYRRGLFPMGISELAGLLGWWSPNPRGILPLDGLRVTRSMRQSAKRYEIRVNTCFTRVMQGCADPSREGGWITRAYGRPGEGVEAVQLELACRAYMQEPEHPGPENWPTPVDQKRAQPTRATIKRVLEAILARVSE